MKLMTFRSGQKCDLPLVFAPLSIRLGIIPSQGSHTQIPEVTHAAIPEKFVGSNANFGSSSIHRDHFVYCIVDHAKQSRSRARIGCF
ncbi:hypothetical protein THF5H11_10265 [Vibrio jasicida]|uniref:Uncharacterized protein n=1 Tax=Vibrio jasicida TaxID=766224 RepID=A0AAU9QGU2_9VIBR|nr:hypothetical protein THF5H11_10265 [Vibrio jasicida]CAH1565647.1 hypothetical protein THF1C08_140030 [Vibrio jasicida]CAH1574800.1 hypothetical protein THF1A12_130031 [Vibrio jasicida]CAH1607416.1 hypothetical protein THF5G08_40176 [Vibrio jasicida]